MKMHTTTAAFVAALALAALWVLPATGTGQGPETAAKLAEEIAAQQAQMADNQSKIESKLAAVAEEVRVAKIYVSRGGRGGGAK